MDKKQDALFKYGIIAPYVTKATVETTARSFAEEVAQNTYFRNGKNVKFSAESIRKWIHNYEQDGYTALIAKTRSDSQSHPCMDDDITLRITQLKTQFPRMTAQAVHEKLVDDGIIDASDLSVRTIQRFVKEQNFDKITEEKERKTYSFAHPNDSWQADTTVGPYIVESGKKYKTYIVVIIDDYSRMVVNAKAFYNDTANNFELTLKEAIKLCGLPKLLYTDHGSPYDNKQINLICARLTIQLKHPKPRDASAKGKVERFNRTLKEEWMYNFDWNRIKDLDELNERLNEQIDKYNNTVHSVTREKPQERYYRFTDVRKVEEETLNKSFFYTVSRKANKTGCVSIENHIYEVDPKLIGKMVDYTYDPFDMSCIYYGEEKYCLLDSVKNSKGHRKRTNTIDYSKVVNKENEELLEHE